MINKTTLLITFLLFNLNSISAQATFNWDTAIDNGDNVTETISGITATFSGLPDINIVDCGGCYGSTGNLVVSQSTSNGTSVTFTFSEPLQVNSILAIDGNGANIDYTFTPTGGSNSIVVASLISGTLPVSLNWTDVTSFTVTSSGSLFAFDDLSIDSPTLSTENYSLNNAIIYPNPVQDILYISNIKNLKSVKVFNSIGQIVINNKNEILDFSNLTKGIYIIQLITEKGIQTKKLIKK